MNINQGLPSIYRALSPCNKLQVQLEPLKDWEVSAPYRIFFHQFLQLQEYCSELYAGNNKKQNIWVPDYIMQ